MKHLKKVVEILTAIGIMGSAVPASAFYTVPFETSDGGYPSYANEPDWARGEYKAECDGRGRYTYGGQTYQGDAIVGLSGNYYNRMAGSAILCDYHPAYYDEYTFTRWPYPATWSFPSSDSGMSWEWDPGYNKATCQANSWVGGVAQYGQPGQQRVDTIRCYYAANGWKRYDNACYVRTFGVNKDNGDNSAWRTSGGWMGYDWDRGHQKGSCDLGGVVAGISHNPVSSPYYPGGLHAILCCPHGRSVY